jgi:hypothetical protein
LWIILTIGFLFSLLRELVSIDLQGTKNNEYKVGWTGIVDVWGRDQVR